MKGRISSMEMYCSLLNLVAWRDGIFQQSKLSFWWNFGIFSHYFVSQVNFLAFITSGDFFPFLLLDNKSNLELFPGYILKKTWNISRNTARLDSSGYPAQNIWGSPNSLGVVQPRLVESIYWIVLLLRLLELRLDSRQLQSQTIVACKMLLERVDLSV